MPAGGTYHPSWYWSRTGARAGIPGPAEGGLCGGGDMLQAHQRGGARLSRRGHRDPRAAGCSWRARVGHGRSCALTLRAGAQARRVKVTQAGTGQVPAAGGRGGQMPLAGLMPAARSWQEGGAAEPPSEHRSCLEGSVGLAAHTTRELARLLRVGCVA